MCNTNERSINLDEYVHIELERNWEIEERKRKREKDKLQKVSKEKKKNSRSMMNHSTSIAKIANNAKVV